MKSSRWLWLAGVVALVWSAPACNLYNDALLREANGGGGRPSGGAHSGGSGSGGIGSGGAPSTGGNIGDGGTIAQGGMGGDADGGSDSGGGGTGGNGDGGTGGGSGGGTGGGSGGAPPLLPIGLIDDFQFVGTASYENAPFSGAWERYIQPGGTWGVTLTSAMVQARPDDAEDFAIHVVAANATTDFWGAGVLVTVSDGGAMDWTEVTGITFDVATMNGETGLRVGIADINSHLPACMTVNAGADCDKHMRAEQVFTIDETFTTIDVPIDNFTGMWIDGRVSALDQTAVCALHFQLDPVGTEVDYYVDNVETY